MSFKSKLNDSIPRHVAVIMDGNGRWAKKRGNKRIFGHKNGVKSVRDTVEAAGEIGVKYLTLYAFSTENWSRPKIEVNALMSLLVKAVKDETANLMEKNVRLMAIGNIESLPANAQSSLAKLIEKTKNNKGLTLILALSYSSRYEIVKAVSKIAEKVKKGELDPDKINEETINNHLFTKNIPDPELLIRTSGEQRISNFLMWQISYSELYFTDILWPDFRKEDFFEAVYNYQHRERRFGKTSEQLK